MKAAPPLKAQLLVSLSRLSRQCASLSRASHGDCHSHCHSRLLPPAQRRLNQLLEAQRWTSPTTAAAHRRLHLDHHDDDIITGVDGRKKQKQDAVQPPSYSPRRATPSPVWPTYENEEAGWDDRGNNDDDWYQWSWSWSNWKSRGWSSGWRSNWRPPTGPPVTRCNICYKTVLGDAAALEAHQATSSKCLAAQAGPGGRQGREPCVHCGKLLAAGDRWAREQHAWHCPGRSWRNW